MAPVKGQDRLYPIELQPLPKQSSSIIKAALLNFFSSFVPEPNQALQRTRVQFTKLVKGSTGSCLPGASAERGR